MPRAFPVLLAGLLFRAVCPADGLTFDAASVKISESDLRQATYSGGPGTSDRGRIHLHIYMTALLQAAFGVQQDQIKGPAWLRDFSAMPFYDIDATMPVDTTLEQYEKMMQNLMAERFHMVFHHDTRDFPGYQLVVDKGGSKLKEAIADPVPANGGLGSDGFPVAPGTRAMGYSATAHQRRKFQGYTMGLFARNLDFLVGRAQGKSLDDGSLQPRIVDKTGLTGKYTFILEYNCPPCAPLAATPARDDAGASDPGGLPDIFVALRKQLGLRLEKSTDVPMDVIVVENLDKIPTAN
jgi:uncharacterized protein (TIGR03435 family)